MYRLLVFLLIFGSLAAQTEQEWLNRGVQAFKNASYPEAAAAFERAVEANPGSVTARLYLGTAHMQQYIPGAEAAENVAHADRAAAEFQKALDLEPGNKVAVASMASLLLNRKRFEDARGWYKRLLTIDPSEKTAYYSIGFSIWAEWYPAYSAARQSLGMRPEAPGPIRDAAVRDGLRARWWTALDEGMANLKQALAIDPEYSDAMAYLNLFVRERADLAVSTGEYLSEVAEADRWVERALASKKRQAELRGQLTVPPPPPPPPPPPGAAAPQRIRVGTQVQESKLLRKVDPVYPALAKEAKIEGTVKLAVIVAKDGSIQQAQVLSGHPLLVPAALEAVKQWQYRQTLLNGEPVEVASQIDFNFTLPN